VSHRAGFQPGGKFVVSKPRIVYAEESAFDERTRENQFDYLAASEQAQASLAEQYAGLPFEE